MIRFAGMMPSNEIKIEKEFIDEFNTKIIIQAGDFGWSVLCLAEGSAFYKDELLDAKINFNNAYNEAVNYYGELTEINNEDDIMFRV